MKQNFFKSDLEFRCNGVLGTVKMEFLQDFIMETIALCPDGDVEPFEVMLEKIHVFYPEDKPAGTLKLFIKTLENYRAFTRNLQINVIE
jgi:hypothetical protein